MIETEQGIARRAPGNLPLQGALEHLLQAPGLDGLHHVLPVGIGELGIMQASRQGDHEVMVQGPGALQGDIAEDPVGAFPDLLLEFPVHIAREVGIGFEKAGNRFPPHGRAFMRPPLADEEDAPRLVDGQDDEGIGDMGPLPDMALDLLLAYLNIPTCINPFFHTTFRFVQSTAFRISNKTVSIFLEEGLQPGLPEKENR